ncbi:MAG: EAL domain-containing protein [Pseudomonadota bacterium]
MTDRGKLLTRLFGTPGGSQPPGRIAETRNLRLMQIFWASEAALLLGAALTFATGAPSGSVIALGAAAALALVPVALRRGHEELAVIVLLTVQVAAVTALAWNAQGLRDEAMLGYPGLLIFAAMIATRRFFVTLVICVGICIATMGVAEELGWKIFEPSDTGLLSALIIILIIAVISFGIGLLSSDVSRLLASLTVENERYRESQQLLEHMAHHDVLTGLPNRVLARHRFDQAYAQCRRFGHSLGVLFLDLDHFKDINDTRGHEVGDLVLIEVGHRLQELVRQADTVCRVGGDEFLILLSDLEGNERVARVADRVKESLRAPVTVSEGEFRVSASIGISIAPLDGDDFDTLLRKADMAMYQAKGEGRDGFAYFDEALDTAIREQLQLLAEMRDGLGRDEFELHYQPRVRMRDGTVVGAEALIRWNHPERGLVMPSAFIPLAERSGLIHDLGAWTLRRACTDCADWPMANGSPIPVSVNVSVPQFARTDFDVQVQAALAGAGLSGDLLELEVTESLLIDDNQGFGEKLRQLRELGVAISIDDFGTGYSNLGVLQHYDFATIKIDRSFISGILENEASRTIVQTILSLARGLGLDAVAEGVENDAVAGALRDAGCRYAQGYLWSRPINASDFRSLLGNGGLGGSA